MLIEIFGKIMTIWSHVTYRNRLMLFNGWEVHRLKFFVITTIFHVNNVLENALQARSYRVYLGIKHSILSWFKYVQIYSCIRIRFANICSFCEYSSRHLSKFNPNFAYIFAFRLDDLINYLHIKYFAITKLECVL